MSNSTCATEENGDPNVVGRWYQYERDTLNERCGRWAEKLAAEGNSSALDAYIANGANTADWRTTMSWCACSKWPCDCEHLVSVYCCCAVAGCEQIGRVYNGPVSVEAMALWAIFGVSLIGVAVMFVWQRKRVRRMMGERAVELETLRSQLSFEAFWNDMRPKEGTCAVSSPSASPGKRVYFVGVREDFRDDDCEAGRSRDEKVEDA